MSASADALPLHCLGQGTDPQLQSYLMPRQCQTCLGPEHGDEKELLTTEMLCKHGVALSLSHRGKDFTPGDIERPLCFCSVAQLFLTLCDPMD